MDTSHSKFLAGYSKGKEGMEPKCDGRGRVINILHVTKQGAQRCLNVLSAHKIPSFQRCKFSVNLYIH